MTKKAFIQDIGFFAIVLIILAFSVIFGFKYFTQINDNLQDSDMSDGSKEIIQDNVNRYSGMMDGIFLFSFVILGITIIIGLSMLPTHPMFFFVGVVLFVFVLIAVAAIGNNYADVTDSPEIADDVANFPVLDWLMTHIVESLLVIGFIGFIVMYAGANR